MLTERTHSRDAPLGWVGMTEDLPGASAAAAADVQTLAKLQGDDPQQLASTLRCIKNQLVGNPHKKISYGSIGAVGAIVTAAGRHEDTAVWVEAAAALASITYNLPESSAQLQQADGLQFLLRMLHSQDDRVSEHAGRALRAVLEVLPAFTPFSQHSASLQTTHGTMDCKMQQEHQGCKAHLRDFAHLHVQACIPHMTSALQADAKFCFDQQSTANNGTSSSGPVLDLLAARLDPGRPRMAIVAADALLLLLKRSTSAPLHPSERLQRIAEAARQVLVSRLPARATLISTQLQDRMLRLLQLLSSQRELAPALQCLPQIVHSVRSDDASVALSACSIAAALTSADARSQLVAVDVGPLKLPAPIGRHALHGSDAAAARGDQVASATGNEQSSQPEAPSAGAPANNAGTGNGASASDVPAHSAGGGAASAEMIAWQLRSLLVPVLVQLLDSDSQAAAVAPVLADVLAGHKALQKAVADSQALDRLASILVAQVCAVWLCFALVSPRKRAPFATGMSYHHTNAAKPLCILQHKSMSCLVRLQGTFVMPCRQTICQKCRRRAWTRTRPLHMAAMVLSRQCRRSTHASRASSASRCSAAVPAAAAAPAAAVAAPPLRKIAHRPGASLQPWVPSTSAFCSHTLNCESPWRRCLRR